MQFNPNPGTPRFEVNVRGEDPVVFSNYDDAKAYYDGLGDVDKSLWDYTNSLDMLDSHALPTKPTPGDNQVLCRVAEDALKRGSNYIATLRGLIRKIIENKCWQELDLTDRPYARAIFRYDSLKDLVEGKLLEGGFNTTIEKIERSLRLAGDRDVLAMFQKEVGITPDDVQEAIQAYNQLSQEEKEEFLNTVNNH